MTDARIIVGDCIERMRELPDSSVDAIVCDPPYELGFMGKGWDKAGVAFDPATWAACLRVLKPGGHLLAFGGTRTFHRMTVAIEDAGFEIKDCLMWLQGQGFPKHKSLLKPGWEPIILGKKRGAGMLSIDACRIGTSKDVPASGTSADMQVYSGVFGPRGGDQSGFNPNIGRWPANVILDETAAAMLDEQSGERTSNSGKPFNRNTDKFQNTYSAFEGAAAEKGYYGDTGGASRFFYTAKASRSERNKGLDGMPERAVSIGDERPSGGMHERFGDANGSGRSATQTNPHPTVKPIALMRWLTRLVCPPGGTVLDPFAGSGSTGCAAALEGFDFIGIEMDPEYAEIAERRIAYWAAQRPTVLQPALPMEGAAD